MTTANSSFTPAQLDLGLMVENPTDDLFGNDGNTADNEEETSTMSKSKLFERSGLSGGHTSYVNKIDKDELESVHGDDKSVIMDDKNHDFPQSGFHRAYAGTVHGNGTQCLWRKRGVYRQWNDYRH